MKPTECPTCGLVAAEIRCPRCNTLKLASCSGACLTCKVGACDAREDDKASATAPEEKKGRA